MKGWAAALVAVALAACRDEAAPAEAAKPIVHVLTSLPLLFDEGFGLGPAKGEAAVFLRQRYTLKPIDLPSQLPPGAVLLAAQPRALPAEELVALDAWVRNGGKLLLLADPLLEWQSERALGDRLRPPVSFADTGLLANWGLRLDAPDKRGIKLVPSGDVEIAYLSPGQLIADRSDCRIEGKGEFANCQIGKGRALVVADADWLNIEALKNGGTDPGDNLFAITLMLAELGAEARL